MISITVVVMMVMVSSGEKRLSIRIIEVGPFAEFLHRRWEKISWCICRHDVLPVRCKADRQIAQELILSKLGLKFCGDFSFECFSNFVCAPFPPTHSQASKGPSASAQTTMYSVIYTVVYSTTMMFVVIGRQSTNV